MVVKFSKEVSEFIEANAAFSNEDLPDKWYWFPQYYRKVGEGLFEVTEWKDLPKSLKHIVEQSEPRNEEE